MAYTSGFFNAQELSPGVYDRVYNASDWASFFASWISNGVFPTNNETGLSVTPGTGLSVSIGVGSAFINGYRIINVGPEIVTLAPANPTDSRIDNIVAQLSIPNRIITLEVITGTPASPPIAPTPTQTDTTFQLVLAQVTIPPKATSITTADITDTRDNPQLCGWASATGTESIQLAKILTQLQTIQNNIVQGSPTLSYQSTQEDADLLCNINSWVFSVNEQTQLKIYATEICLQGGEMQNVIYPLAFNRCAFPFLTPSGVKAIGGGWEVPGSATQNLYGKDAAIPGSSTTGCLIINPNPNPGAFFLFVIGY